MKAIFAAAICFLTPLWMQAAVADSSGSGFTVKVTLNVQSAPEDVYRKFVRNVGEWWDSAHTFSGNSRNLMIDDRPMGCFCEKLPNGAVRHMEVVRLDSAKTIVMIGALGPLQSMAVTGSLTVVFTAVNGGTKLDVTYAVGGYDPQGFKELAPAVDSVITGQFVRFKNYAERGAP